MLFFSLTALFFTNPEHAEEATAAAALASEDAAPIDETVEEAVLEVAESVEEALEAAEETAEAVYLEEAAVPEAEENGENA